MKPSFHWTTCRPNISDTELPTRVVMLWLQAVQDKQVPRQQQSAYETRTSSHGRSTAAFNLILHRKPSTLSTTTSKPCVLKLSLDVEGWRPEAWKPLGLPPPTFASMPLSAKNLCACAQWQVRPSMKFVKSVIVSHLENSASRSVEAAC
jgi:hypothetical protein